MKEYKLGASSQDGAAAVLDCAATQVCPVSAQLCSMCAGSCHASGMVQSCGHDAYLWREVTYVACVGCCCCVTLRCHPLAPAAQLLLQLRWENLEGPKFRNAARPLLHALTCRTT